MKTTVLLLLAACGSAPEATATSHLNPTAAKAVAEGVERVIADNTSSVTLTLDETTVHCSTIGYGVSNLKVLVPQLAELTVLNHRVFDLGGSIEGGPCLSAGACNPELLPRLQDASRPQEAVDVRVIQRVVLTPGVAKCDVRLDEQVETTIRGIPFHHFAVTDLPQRELSDCR